MVHGTPADGDREVAVRVEARILEGHRKMAVATTPWGTRFTLVSDEGPPGGEDSAPPPLAYFAAGVAF